MTSFNSKYGPIVLIIGGLLAWGAFHALGAYLSLAQRPGWASPAVPMVATAPDGGDAIGASEIGPKRDIRKAVVVGVCVTGFISFWMLAIVVGNRRRKREAEKRVAEIEAAEKKIDES